MADRDSLLRHSSTAALTIKACPECGTPTPTQACRDCGKWAVDVEVIPVERIEALKTAHAALVEAGEELFRRAAFPGCAHNDPRHPTNGGCEHCQKRGAAMDAWDEEIQAATLERAGIEGPEDDCARS